MVEFTDCIAPSLDKEIGKNFHKILDKQGFEFMLSAKVIKADKKLGGIFLTISDVGGSKELKLSCDALVAVGRKPNTEGLGLDDAGIILDDRININDQFQTNIPSI